MKPGKCEGGKNGKNVANCVLEILHAIVTGMS